MNASLQSLGSLKAFFVGNRTAILRVTIVAVAVAISSLAYFLAVWKDAWFGIKVTPGQGVWVAASAQIVAAVYKWGVGSWSRYTPPAEARMADASPTVKATT